MISAVMLNWCRPANVAIIANSLLSHPRIASLTVWSNSSPENDVQLQHPFFRYIRSNHDMGLYTRFAAAILAPTDCVLIQDDDLLLPHETIITLYSRWQDHPHLIHGIFGRRAKHNGDYGAPVRGNKGSPIVLTRAMLIHRKYMAAFFDAIHDPEIDEIQRQSIPFGNGEDIIMSYVVRKATGSFNCVWDVPVRELNDANAMNGRDREGHRRHRTRLMQACENWLKK